MLRKPQPKQRLILTRLGLRRANNCARGDVLSEVSLERLKATPNVGSLRLQNVWRSLPLTYRCEERNAEIIRCGGPFDMPLRRTLGIRGTTYGLPEKHHEGKHHESF